MKIIDFSILILCLPLYVSAQSKTSEITQMTGGFWQAISFEDTSYAWTAFRKMGISLTTNGKVSGFAVCNNISGTYTIKPYKKELSFSSMNMSWRGCAEAVSAEYRFLDALKQTSCYQLSGDKLVLYSGSKKQMSLVKQRSSR